MRRVCAASSATCGSHRWRKVYGPTISHRPSERWGRRKNGSASVRFRRGWRGCGANWGTCLWTPTASKLQARGCEQERATPGIIDAHAAASIPKGLHPAPHAYARDCCNPCRIEQRSRGTVPRGSSEYRATSGWLIESLWDSHTIAHVSDGQRHKMPTKSRKRYHDFQS